MNERLDALTLPLWGSRLIEASAGTGKTWTIAALYLRLVLGHGDVAGPLAPDRILVMTFTRAATRELSDRIRSRLVEAARCFRGDPVRPDDALMHGLLAAYPAGGARDEAGFRLAMAAEGMDDAAVFTIDAWVQRMLREHAFDSGCLFDEEVQADEEAMLVEAVHDYWRREVYPLSADAVDGIVAVWAGVESLLTDMRRLLPYAAQITEQHDALGAVWQRESTAHRATLQRLKDGWEERVQRMRDWVREQLAAKDKPFHGSRLQAGRTDGWLDIIDDWARTPEQAAPSLTDAARRRLSPEGMQQALNAGRTLEIPPLFAELHALLNALDALADPAHALRRHAASHIAAGLRATKQRVGIYGFDDMLARLDDALAGAGGGRLRERIVAQYPVALIDEFQDTSPLQYRIFDTLYRTADNDRATALLLIGDPKQSIYGFRGADIQSYLRARRAMADRQYFLTTNYRSTAPLVAAVNRLFETAEGRDAGAFRFGAVGQSPVPFLPVDARGRSETLMTTAGPVAALTLCHDAELSSRRDAQRRFAEHCAEQIATTLNDPQAGFVDADGTFMRLRPADLTVLVRDRHEAAAIRRALRTRRIPSVYLSDQDSVFMSPEASDLLHWLRAVADPLDSRRARVAYATALVGLSFDEIAQLSDDDVAFERRLEALKTLNGEWRRQGLLPMLRRTLHLLDLPARWLAQPDGERRLTNVLHLAELLQAASAKLDGEQAVIRWLTGQLDHAGRRADEQIVRLESDADLVKVVTIHKAKGLEYPLVYIPFVCSHREPRWKAGAVAAPSDADGERVLTFVVDDAVKAQAELENQQEDLRLLYVAVTRARHALWLGVAPLKLGRSSKCAFHRSAFGYLLAGDEAVAEHEIAARLHAVFDGWSSVRIVPVDTPALHTRLIPSAPPPPLVTAPDYATSFERDWAIGSFSALVRDLERLPVASAIVAPDVEEELLTTPEDGDVVVSSNTPRHRFPRGALPGNFLHDQLEWLAAQRFALARDAGLRDQLARRCDRQGWGHRASDVVTWLGEVVATPLPAVGVALDALERILPEMEFWFPNDGASARQIDLLCRRHLLGGRERPPLPDRRLRGMLMGFADLVFEIDGRYWVLDYKSNGLGADDGDYTHDALERSMAEHRYDVQAAVYLLALHRLLRERLGDEYDPARHLGGALYLFLRGIRGPAAGCYVIVADATWLDALDDALAGDVEMAA
ncbi:MAG: exodeoxyribonuclease V subunit beta [Burkholderiaceae bacterium]